MIQDTRCLADGNEKVKDLPGFFLPHNVAALAGLFALLATLHHKLVQLEELADDRLPLFSQQY